MSWAAQDELAEATLTTGERIQSNGDRHLWLTATGVMVCRRDARSPDLAIAEQVIRYIYNSQLADAVRLPDGQRRAWDK